MRQRDNANFAIALINMARGVMTADDVSLLRSRCFPEIPADVQATEPIYLFATNAAVDAYNTTVLQTMNTEHAISHAYGAVSGDGSRSAPFAILASVQSKKTQDTMGLPSALFLRIGARYMITSNVDTGDGLVNGVTGRLRRIDLGRHTGRQKVIKPLRVWLEFDNERSGEELRNRQRNLITRLQVTSSWTPVEPVTLVVQRRESSN